MARRSDRATRARRREPEREPRPAKAPAPPGAAELAGAAAHELNQPLTSVLGYADLLKRRIPEDDVNRRAIEVIYREAERMAEIVRKIGRITRYETTTYLGNVKMLDIDKSTKE